jgi:hypothetical protein
MKITKDDDYYSMVMKSITKVRDQGDPPRSDVLSLDAYICDLCKGTVNKEKITQCPFCGRWVCKKNCWHTEHLACNPCVGVLKLCKESVELERKKKNDKQTLKNQNKRNTIKVKTKSSSILEKISKKKSNSKVK